MCFVSMVSPISMASIWHQHYNDVIMGTMASQTTSFTIVYSTVYSGTDQRKHQSFASLAICARNSPGLCKGNSPVTGEFPAQRASYAENVSLWWHHHEEICNHLAKLGRPIPPTLLKTSNLWIGIMRSRINAWMHSLYLIALFSKQSNWTELNKVKQCCTFFGQLIGLLVPIEKNQWDMCPDYVYQNSRSDRTCVLERFVTIGQLKFE